MNTDSIKQRRGYYGPFGGQYMPELLMGPILQLEQSWIEFTENPENLKFLNHTLSTYAGRPTPLTEVSRFAEAIGLKAQVFLKREDLLHTGAHKLNNSIGQCFLAKGMGKTRVIAETGAGQHGVATATACARLGLECAVYMGSKDMQRQQPNVDKMKLLGATVIPVRHGSATLKDAINEALRDWSSTYENSHYCLGSALGPHPYPEMVKVFQSVIGQEILNELDNNLPDLMIACVGGGSNAIGMFAPFLKKNQVKLVGVEAGGRGSNLGEHAARFQGGRPGVLHGAYTYLLQDTFGQVSQTHSISAGLDYPSIGPEHAHLKEQGRVTYVSVSDSEALSAFQLLSRTEGIIPALESSHALAYLVRIAPQLTSGMTVVVNLSGRGDKDLPSLLGSLL
jgi:tryptophan synthase beta subunit